MKVFVLKKKEREVFSSVLQGHFCLLLGQITAVRERGRI